MVGLGKTFFQIRNVELLLVVQTSILLRDLHMRECLLRLAKIILRGKAGAGAMFLPFMLNQAAAGHEVQHVVHGSGSRPDLRSSTTSAAARCWPAARGRAGRRHCVLRFCTRWNGR